MLFYSLVKNTSDTLAHTIERAAKYISVEEELKKDGQEKGRDLRRESVVYSIANVEEKRFIQ